MVHHHGRDALRHQIRSRTNLRVRVTKPSPLPRAIVSMRMNVDEPRRHMFASGIDDARGLRTSQTAEGDDAPVADADVGRECRVARAVVYTAALDKKVKGLRGKGRRHRRLSHQRCG